MQINFKLYKQLKEKCTTDIQLQAAIRFFKLVPGEYAARLERNTFYWIQQKYTSGRRYRRNRFHYISMRIESPRGGNYFYIQFKDDGKYTFQASDYPDMFREIPNKLPKSIIAKFKRCMYY